MSLNVVLDTSVILDLLSKSQNDNQHTFTRLQKSPVKFWVPCCLLPPIESQLHPKDFHPLEKLLKDVQLLSSLAAHWRIPPPKNSNRIQALMSLDASILTGDTIIWTDDPHFISAHPDIEAGDEQSIFAMIAVYEDENNLEIVNLANQQFTLRPALEEQFFKVLKHGQYLAGAEVDTLEQELAAFVGTRHCVTVANSTSALLIALMAVGIRAGDEIITSPLNFVATTEAIVLLGARPIFVDIDPRTFLLNPDLVEAAITHRTKAIVPVNLYGQCADFFAINAIANKYYLPVLEDATQSFGAIYHNHNSCSLSAIGCTSFSPSSPLGGYGNGGACFTDDDQLADLLRQLRIHGQETHYHYQMMGIEGRLDTLQASLLLAKLNHFPKELKNRVQLGQTYSKLLGKLEGRIKTQRIESYNTSAYTQFVIVVNNRQEIQQKLQKRGIPTTVHYPIPIHLQPAFAYLNKNVGTFPIAEATAESVLSLPMHPYLTEGEITRIVHALEEILLS